MNDDNDDSNAHQQKSWLDRISHFLTGEPKDREDLLEILREAQEKHLLDHEALSMIEGVLQVSEMRVRDIMIPRVQMVVLPKDAELETVFPLVTESAHSRFPVIGEDRSEVVGIMLAKDLLAHIMKDKNLKVQDIMRPVRFIPESKRLNVLLKEFRTNRNHMAIVVDEYGAAAGLVTIEDVLEQIVGEIEDEHDFDEEEYIFRRSDTEYTIKALTPIEDFNDYFSVDFDDEEFDTIGGLVVHQLEHMPQKGETVEMGPFRFEILRADNRRVYLLKLKIIKKIQVAEENT
ncbi:HlyC/CorC family transporter [Thiolapillus sp.]|uniref:HlyC/CorC family transporter n=1 Tax=Thiolapillus sp. TaxID=2017437 RepID=UPI0025F77841|nr:transporter associated domain-containing protein [Thiolapillus sp.]